MQKGGLKMKKDSLLDFRVRAITNTTTTKKKHHIENLLQNFFFFYSGYFLARYGGFQVISNSGSIHNIIRLT